MGGFIKGVRYLRDVDHHPNCSASFAFKVIFEDPGELAVAVWDQPLVPALFLLLVPLDGVEALPQMHQRCVDVPCLFQPLAFCIRLVRSFRPCKVNDGHLAHGCFTVPRGVELDQLDGEQTVASTGLLIRCRGAFKGRSNHARTHMSADQKKKESRSTQKRFLQAGRQCFGSKPNAPPPRVAKPGHLPICLFR